MLRHGRVPSLSSISNFDTSSLASSSGSPRTSPMNSPYVSPGGSPRESLNNQFSKGRSLQPPPSNTQNKSNSSNTFVHKLYNMVVDTQYQHLIAWNYTGSSFIVCNIMEFSRDVLPKHFKHNNFSSFVRQLNMYGFHKVNKSPRGHRTLAENQIWEFSHSKFIKDRPDLLDEIKRKSIESENNTSRFHHQGDINSHMAMMQVSQSEMVQRLMQLQDNFSQVVCELQETRSRQQRQHYVLKNMLDFLSKQGAPLQMPPEFNMNGFEQTNTNERPPSIFITSHDTIVPSQSQYMAQPSPSPPLPPHSSQTSQPPPPQQHQRMPPPALTVQTHNLSSQFNLSPAMSPMDPNSPALSAYHTALNTPVSPSPSPFVPDDDIPSLYSPHSPITPNMFLNEYQQQQQQQQQQNTFYAQMPQSNENLLLMDPSAGRPTKKSTWTCRNSGRGQICEFTNLCLDRYRDPFVISDKEPPRVNVMSADESSDIWFQPAHYTSSSIKTQYINETVFVYGLYSPHHFSHMLYNGLIPLYSTMQDYGASEQSWTMRAGTFDDKHAKLDLLLPIQGDHDIVLKQDYVSLPSSQPICFSRAIVGTGNRCSHPYCENQVPAKHYDLYKQFVFDQPHTQDNACEASRLVYKQQGQYRVGILNRKHSRHVTNMPDLISRLTAMTQEQDDIDFSVVSIDFESDCTLVNTAHVVKDLDILIAPYGNGLGAGLFMKQDAVAIAIMARYWNDGWFKWPMTAIGRRVFNFECNSEACKEYEEELAQHILSAYHLELNKTQMQEFLTTSNPEPLLDKYIPGLSWYPFLQYYKDVSRRLEIDRFIPFLKQIMANKPPSNVSFVESCKTPNVCCDLDCEEPLDRNVFGEKNAWH
ncbi:HSF-type DNA-binding-domain-containing protein [Gilbertella persicaria]|uniref:HSF-type DNA-binding-domain-containing protein n=1 Tax=Gilbertella persicaria TaxID=101096 RepID=UPI00221F1471|nr:HSF-type DNA-binding-domain-containing protein [Gilbertella persicaria]KAI8047592.1 HSF-type DNA-binding-domain-containing protein [Gilbertella persicaria]